MKESRQRQCFRNGFTERGTVIFVIPSGYHLLKKNEKINETLFSELTKHVNENGLLLISYNNKMYFPLMKIKARGNTWVNFNVVFVFPILKSKVSALYGLCYNNQKAILCVVG